MEKVFHFDSPQQSYQADAAVVCCFDHRFQLAFDKFLKRMGINTSDVVKIAGGAKSLASPQHETDRQFVVRQIEIAKRLHGVKLVIISLHSDCGAYGGLADGFSGDLQLESRLQQAELRKAAEYLLENVSDIEVQAYFVAFDGIWAVELNPTQVVNGYAAHA